MGNRGLKPGVIAPVTHAERCPHCGKRFVRIWSHRRKCVAQLRIERMKAVANEP